MCGDGGRGAQSAALAHGEDLTESDSRSGMICDSRLIFADQPDGQRVDLIV